jgi:hypothetical protein
MAKPNALEECDKKKRPGTLQKIPPLSYHADEQTTGGNSGFDPQVGGL